MTQSPDLDALLARLEELAAAQPADAIGKELAGAPRVSATISLRQHDAVRRFREEVQAGLIQADTANQFLRLVQTVLAMTVKP